MKFLLLLFVILPLFNVKITNKTLDYYIFPTDYISISSNYGYRTLYNDYNFHNGIDFFAPFGSKVYSTKDGYIEFASFSNQGYGNTIVIDHGNFVKSLYSHLSENFIVNIGDFVRQGEIIGYVGPKFLSSGILNGNTTGPHLHFSIFINNSTVDPLSLNLVQKKE